MRVLIPSRAEQIEWALYEAANRRSVEHYQQLRDYIDEYTTCDVCGYIVRADVGIHPSCDQEKASQ